MGENKRAMEQMFTSKKHVSCTTQKLLEMAMIKKMDISNLTTRIWEASVGCPLIVTLCPKNREFHHVRFLSNTAEFIFE